MYALAYPFHPWSGPRVILDGPSILEYVRDTAREYHLDGSIRFQHRVVAAAWSSDESRWTVEVERIDTGETVHVRCGFLYSCMGYYRYDQGYTPEFPGAERFGGEVVHPQFWTEDIDHVGKRVVVVGSGATAVTLVPALAGSAAHVTMLQRSPSYVVSVPALDPIAGRLCRLLPTRINQSWTLGADLSSEQVCRLLAYMERQGYARCTPRAPAGTVASVPFVTLHSGYVQRAVDRFPRQAPRDPWQRRPNYALNRRAMRRARINDPALEFSRPGTTVLTPTPLAV